MFRDDPEQARRELVAVLERTRGNLARSAFQLGVGRRHLYKLLDREQLWDEVERIRAATAEAGIVQHGTRPRRRDVEPDWIADARAALRGGA